ncbi:MAG: acylphosphatase [Thaumarchaeota archaeon]|nr:acylphosphatase [Nitrososphaerota archaeon]|tara:strand:+ start:1311 stop:1586 length:276 start_codon:yes stop_codon:yes gene_type:complete
MNKIARLIITGKVQGVGFRAFVRNRAMKNNVTGWVKNHDDGSVEALFYGSQENIDKLIDITRRGTPWSQVSDVLVTYPDDNNEYSLFEIIS